MKTALVLLFTVALATFSPAQEVPLVTFQQLYDQADLIVIARPVSVKDTTERIPLQDIGHPITAAELALPEAERGKLMGLGIETEFAIETVVKGGKQNGDHFVLHHYKWEKRAKSFEGGPRLVAFDPANQQPWLLFLKREADGRYAPVFGQTYAGVCGIIPADQIDLVAIGRPVPSTARTDELTLTNFPPSTRGTGTHFAVQQVLRGDHERKEMLVRPFAVYPDRSYLLFLKKETDEFFKTIPTGLVSPASDVSIIKLPDQAK